MNRSSIFSTSFRVDKKPNLSILIPCRDLMHSAHALSVIDLVKFNTMQGIDTHVFMDSSTVLLTQRERLVEQAISANSDYILWLDSDIFCPSMIAVKLLTHKEPVIACNYIRRQLPAKGVAYEKMYDWNNPLDFSLREKLVEVEGIGMGCMLMKTEIFKKLEKPWFEFKYCPDNDSWLGEDMVLCEKIRSLGYKIMVDVNLSHQIRHLGTWAFGPDLLDKNQQ
jgi:hypothetical protein